MNGDSPTTSEENSPLFELYHENSKQRRYDLAFGQRIYAANNDPAFHRALARSFMSYPGAETIALPDVTDDRTAVERRIASRRSIRRFTDEPITIDELTRLLAYGNGLTGSLRGHPGSPDQPVRAAPSGGAVFPVELYVAALSVEAVAPGIHHYNVARHSLERLRSEDTRARLAETCGEPDLLAGAAAVVVMTAVLGRGHLKYGERAYRFALIECGHIAQNIALTAAARGLGTVPLGGFVDDEIEDLLGVDGVDETAVYLVVVGRPEPPRARDDAADLMNRLLASLDGNAGPRRS